MTAGSSWRRYRMLLMPIVIAVAATVAGAAAPAFSAVGPGNGLLPPPLISPGGGEVDPPPAPYGFYDFFNSGAFTYTKATASKADTTIRLPLELMRAYIGIGRTSDFLYLDSGASLWVLSPPGTAQQYGVFQPITVNTLAFGSVPVSATVELTQLLQPNGELAPLKLLQHNLQSSQAYTPVIVSGQLALKLSNVRVDQVPLDVGDHCGTTQPISIKLASKDSTSYPDPISGGQLTGTADIGAFSGCVSSTGEDLSRLFTGMLSRTGNPMVINQGRAGYWKEPNLCPTANANGDPACSIPAPPK